MTELSQVQILQELRDLTDDLQASVTTREWARRSKALDAFLHSVGDRWLTKMVQHNVGERRHFLARFAAEHGLPTAGPDD